MNNFNVKTMFFVRLLQINYEQMRANNEIARH